MMQDETSKETVGTRTINRWRPRIILDITSILLLTLLIATLYYGNSAYHLLTDLQQYTWQIDKVESLQGQLQNAETNARNFQATADKQYLEDYLETLAQMAILLNDIDQQIQKTPQNAAEYNHLKHLINEKIAALSLSINAQQSDKDQLKELIEHGNQITNEVRVSLYALRSHLDINNASYFINSLKFVVNSPWLMIFLFTGAFILLIGMFILTQIQVRLRHKIASLMRSEKEQLEKLVAQRTTELNDLATYLTRVSEAEKRHIAQELHDEMGALLTAAMMDTTWIIRDLDEGLKEKYDRRLNRLSKSLDAAIKLKRKITTDLKPPLLQELGLIESLRAMGEDFAMDSPYKVDILIPDTLPELDEERTLAIFRIVQESLTNIRKYAEAKTVKIQIKEEDMNINILIEDDGLGFDEKQLKTASHGISGMRHRAQMFGGKLQVTSAPGQGTLIKAYIPVCNTTNMAK